MTMAILAAHLNFTLSCEFNIKATLSSLRIAKHDELAYLQLRYRGWFRDVTPGIFTPLSWEILKG